MLTFAAHHLQIIGLLGCSTELLQLISNINQLRTLLVSQTYLPSIEGLDIKKLAVCIHERLTKLKQVIHIQPGETTGTISHMRISLTAEFYRIAALLYLYQEVVPPSTIPDYKLKKYVEDGFLVLNQMEICTSPWPLFILACSVTKDVDRIKVMQAIEDGDRERRVGNYRIIGNLVKAVWRRQDLMADEKQEVRVDWRELMVPGEAMPSFI